VLLHQPSTTFNYITAMSDTQKNAVVTGSAQGIGRCVARTFAEKGWKVFLIDVQEVREHVHPSKRTSLS